MKSGKLEKTAKWVICVVGSLIMAWLCWYALWYTQYVEVFGNETPLNTGDSRLRNLLILVLAAGVTFLLCLLEQKGSERLQSMILYGTLAFAVVWIGFAGIWWVTGANRQPVADQAYVYGGASYFIKGDYGFLSAGAYFGECPQNLGITALIEVLFRIVGSENYRACQLLNVAAVVGIIVVGFGIVRTQTEHIGVAVAYNLMAAACLPLIFYTSWVYGDIPGILGMEVCVYGLLKYLKSGKTGFLLLMIAAEAFAYVVRKNSLILIIALVLTGGVSVLTRRDRKTAVALLLAAVIPLLAYAGIIKMYEIRSGHELSKGMSNISYFVMGLTENNGKYGWYTEYCKEIYHANDCDTALADAASLQDLKEVLHDFAEDPSYAVTFFREKLLSQWNMPLYESLYFGYSIRGELGVPESDLAVQIYLTWFPKLLSFCDRLQMVVYAGMLLYFLLGVRREGDILRQVLAVAVIGGFLFSLIWEAKARYCLPYYLFMFPMAAIGWRLALEQVLQLTGKIRRGKREDNVVPFRKAA